MPKQSTTELAPSKAAIARKYRAEHGSGMASLKLARIMYNENNILFKNIEDARTALRYIEGKSGRGSIYGLSATLRSGVAKDIITESRAYNPYKLPESDETPYEPFIIKNKKILLISDVHLPYHSVGALSACFDYAKKQKPDCVLLNGDILDFYALSRFVRDPKKRDFAGELNMFKEFIIVVQKTFKNARIIYKMGNHEERYEQFLYMKAGEISGVEEFQLEAIIKARANGIEIVSDRRIMRASGLNIIHGHEFAGGFFSPVNPARGLYLRGKRSAIQGHQHQSSEHTEKDMDDKIITTWSLGCLSELHPHYMPLNKWNHGFAMVEGDGKNSYDVMNKRIYKNKVL